MTAQRSGSGTEITRQCPRRQTEQTCEQPSASSSTLDRPPTPRIQGAAGASLDKALPALEALFGEVRAPISLAMQVLEPVAHDPKQDAQAFGWEQTGRPTR